MDKDLDTGLRTNQRLQETLVPLRHLLPKLLRHKDRKECTKPLTVHSESAPGHYYSEALYDRTADFDNISFLESQSDNHLRQAGLEKDLPDDLHASFKPPHGCACQRS